MLHRETDAAKVARNRDAIFDLHASALAWLEALHRRSRIPFGKFDFLLVPSFQFGGMEHPGAIFYNAATLLLDASATQNQKLGRASLIAHETAHMWFGDLVTMRWFNDVWMKEVFANFMAAKIVNPSFPRDQSRAALPARALPVGLRRRPHRRAPTPIRQPLDNLNEAGSLYGAIIYQKAPIVMRQLEGILGEAALRDGLREYLRTHRFGNATWPDSDRARSTNAPPRISPPGAAPGSKKPGVPSSRTELRRRAAGASRASPSSSAIRIHGAGWSGSSSCRWRSASADGAAHAPRPAPGSRADVPGAQGLPAPRFVLPSGGGLGYGGFVLDPASAGYLATSLPEIRDPLTRGAAWITLWEQMLDGRTPASGVVDLALRALPRETDELNIQRILSYARQAYLGLHRRPTRARRSRRGSSKSCGDGLAVGADLAA